MAILLGYSSQNRALEVEHFPADEPLLPPLLLLGGVHGDEIEGVWLMEELAQIWKKTPPRTPFDIYVWAQVNPDGVATNERRNGNGIDLNRNLPTKDWSPEIKTPRYHPGTTPGSEPENDALIRLIDKIQPRAILSAHSFSNFQVNVNGPSKAWGEVLGKICGYPVTEDIGYPTPGSLGTYAGAERKIPTITLEIEKGLTKPRVLDLHLPVIDASLRYWSEKNHEK